MRDFDPLALCVPGVKALKPYEPGKPVSELQRELGIRDVIKLASNENPLGASPKALAAMRAALAQTALYPDGNAFALKRALAAHHGVDAQCLTVGSGSDHILELMARVFLGPGCSAVISRYAFAIYAIVSQAAGAELRVAEANPAAHPRQPYGHNLKNMLAAVRSDTRVVFIANPNNPTGTFVDRAELIAFLDALPRRVMVLLDEAYTEFARDFEPEFPDGRDLLEDFPNLVVMRTFSKAYGLAGARVGYALAHPKVTDLLNRVRLSFNPSSLGQAGAVAALADREHLRRTLELNRVELPKMAASLKALGLRTLPSVCNFVTADMGRPGREVFQALLRQGVIVRPLDNYDLRNHLRLSVGLPEHNARLLAALKKALGV